MRCELDRPPLAGKPAHIANVHQEMLAQLVGTTRQRVNYFLNEFRGLGLIDYTRSAPRVIYVRSDLLHMEENGDDELGGPAREGCCLPSTACLNHWTWPGDSRPAGPHPTSGRTAAQWPDPRCCQLVGFRIAIAIACHAAITGMHARC